ncbi:hypothetical protein HAZT_HAZT009154 [Hyalella azteca]|uniref:Uncharacterized protein n=1 Tax=Hyalella azteca TaxID=294128 RepID=A0A6A0GRV6_HYAAZ|nr:hypothetical protein HAZT_HAZT009154 [Hyalella azteca]
MDALPVLSQTKSVVQWVCRDPEGAKRTQVNFSRQCPVVSQIRSAVEVAKGDTQAARETQKEFGKFIGSLVDGVPVAGHLKGAFHYAMKDKEKGDAAMKAASHTTAVIGGGVGGFLLGGPVGAVAGGIGAGAFMDSTITAVDTGMHSKFLPYGILEPLSDPKNPGKWCDAVGGVMIDGMRIMEWFDGADDLFNFSSPDETQQKVSMVGREEFDLVDEESLSCNFSVTELEND